MAYCDVENIKDYLGITKSVDDQLIDDLRSQAQKMIDTFCRQPFEATADSTRTFDAIADVDGATLYFDHPISSITSVTNGDGNTIASSAYVTEPRNSAPYRAITLKANQGNLWTFSTSPEGAISIVGRWAYSTTAPDDIKHACLILTAWLFRRKDSIGSDTDRPLVTGDGVTILPGQMPNTVHNILTRRQRVWFGLSG